MGVAPPGGQASAGSAAPAWGSLWLPALAAALASALLYAPTVSFQFVNWDDNHYVYANPHLVGPALTFLRWAFTTNYQLHWSPLLWVSLGTDRALWGLAPAGYHLTNVLLHGLNSFLVVLLCFRLLRAARPGGRADGWLAAAAGLVFGLHPLHVEAVAWVSSRKDVLYSAFYLGSVLAYCGYATAQGRGRKGLYALSLVAFLSSLMSKPMAVTLPVVLLLLDLYPLRRIRSASDALLTGLVEKLPFYLGSLVVSLVTTFSWRHGSSEQADRLFHELAYPMGARAWEAVNAVVTYLWKTFLPLGLSAHQLVPAGTGVRHPWALVAFILVSAGVLLLLKRVPGLTVAWTCYLVTVFPTLGLIRVFGVTPVADRFVYLPILAVILPVVAGAGAVLRRLAGPWRAGFAALCILAVASLAGLTLRQSGYWRDGVTFWSRNVEQNPADFSAVENLGDAYLEAGDLDRAYLWFANAVARYRYKPEAHFKLAVVLLRLGRNGEAVRSLDDAITTGTMLFNMARTRNEARSLAGYHRTRGQVLSRQGLPLAAAEDLLRWAELSGDVAQGTLLEARRLAGEGRQAEAVALLEGRAPAAP